VRPLVVPAGIFTVTGPSSVGTLTCAPSTASWKVIGTLIVSESSLRPR
jgi:hypothetical protein